VSESENDMLRGEIAQGAETLAIWVGRALEARQEVETLRARIALAQPLLSEALLGMARNENPTHAITEARKILSGE